jgi:wobble nucleotide-excising tRNase
LKCHRAKSGAWAQPPPHTSAANVATNFPQHSAAFWVVRKSDAGSLITRHDGNPIKTSYEPLWHEMRRADRCNLTIQNMQRPILESYFKILGGMDFDNICAKFEGKEQLICQSLLSSVPRLSPRLR